MQQHSLTILKCNSHAHDPTLPNSNQLKLKLDKCKINIPQNVDDQQSETTSKIIHSNFFSSIKILTNC